MKLSNVSWLPVCLLQAGFLAASFVVPVAAQEPYSSIPWLNNPQLSTDKIYAPLTQQPTPARSVVAPVVNLPVSDSAQLPDVVMTSLDGENRQTTIGLVPSSVSGLPHSLWRPDTTDDIARLIKRIPRAPLPALQALLHKLLLSEAYAPDPGSSGISFLELRAETLKNHGAVHQANALLEISSNTTKGPFSVWFDTALLLDEPDNVCRILLDTPTLAPEYAKRIYCLARLSEWENAALIYDLADTLGQIDPEISALLAVYLDPEIELSDLDARNKVSPLIYRLWENAGQRLSSNTLPLPYAVADLSVNAGWKAQIEAAERLARHGVLSSNQLLGLYTEQRAAASGGVWERVRGVTEIDAALSQTNIKDLEDALPRVWRDMQAAGLELIFADLFAQPLQSLSLSPDLAGLVLEIGLLSPLYRAYASALTKHAANAPQTWSADQKFMISVATGTPDPTLARTAVQKAIVAGFDPAQHSAETGSSNNPKAVSLGAQMLTVISQLESSDPNSAAFPRALGRLRALGQDETARRAALQILLHVGKQ